MAIHKYICKQCGRATEVSAPVGTSPQRPDLCSGCGSGDATAWRRDFSGVGLARPMMSHWNATTGTEVSDMKGFKDDLKRKSEEATLKSGVEHNYEPIEYADLRPVIDASEAKGLEETNRARHAAGERTIDL